VAGQMTSGQKPPWRTARSKVISNSKTEPL